MVTFKIPQIVVGFPVLDSLSTDGRKCVGSIDTGGDTNISSTFCTHLC